MVPNCRQLHVCRCLFLFTLVLLFASRFTACTFLVDFPPPRFGLLCLALFLLHPFLKLNIRFQVVPKLLQIVILLSHIFFVGVIGILGPRSLLQLPEAAGSLPATVALLEDEEILVVVVRLERCKPRQE